MRVLDWADLAVDEVRGGAQAAVASCLPDADSVDAMLRRLSATSEGFAYGSTALAAALKEQRRATIAANVRDGSDGLPHLSCWRCQHDERGIDLVPFAFEARTSHDPGNRDAGAANLVGDGGPGDVLIVCDPWGDNELLWWALRIASQRRVTTVAITTEQPNMLAALADHSVRVAAIVPGREESVVAALRFLVQTAGGSLESDLRRATHPLRVVGFS
jgi:hypothetical protein